MNEQETISIAREIIGTTPLCNLATLDAEGFPHVRPMYTLSHDEDMTIYFATHKNLAKCEEIRANPKVCVSYSVDESNMLEWQHVIIKGLAKVSDDGELKHRLWQDMLREYFPGGVDDPNFVIVVVKPNELSYTKGEMYPPASVKF